eukprot:6002114-Amphidinium_carterae.1
MSQQLCLMIDVYPDHIPVEGPSNVVNTRTQRGTGFEQGDLLCHCSGNVIGSNCKHHAIIVGGTFRMSPNEARSFPGICTGAEYEA